MATNKTHYKRHMNDQEVEALLRWCHQPMWKLIFGIMAYMGLRSCEVCRIRYSDVLDDCSMIRIELAKSGVVKDRIVPLRIKEQLRQWVKDHEKDGHEFLFFPYNNSSKAEHIQTSTIRWKLIKFRQQTGISDKYYKNYDRISSHALRHHCITKIYKLTGYDLVATKEIIGHRRIDTTQLYITHEDKEKAVMSQI